jgi:signal transduction histidine kinase
MRALVELRDLAHGIYPVILSEAGLGPALASYIDTAPLLVELVDLPDVRLTADAETAAYLTVTTAVDEAARRSSSKLVVNFTLRPCELTVDIVDDGSVSAPTDIRHLRDRVGALGGRVDVDGTRLEAVIPCA